MSTRRESRPSKTGSSPLNYPGAISRGNSGSGTRRHLERRLASRHRYDMEEVLNLELKPGEAEVQYCPSPRGPTEG